MGVIAVDQLVHAARGNDSEVAARAVDALRVMLRQDDSELSNKAEAALESIAEQGSLAVAQQAEVALDFFDAAQAVSARKKLEELGAIFSDTGLSGLRLEIAEDWKGDSRSLKLVTRLQKVVHVSLFGLQLTERDAVTLGRLRGIERLDLYGVGLSDAAIRQLKQRLQETEIDIRKGGKLGIAGMPLQGQCVIAGIQPGSSAEKAGLLPQDVITEINGTAISDFGACTRIIGEHKPGEEISVVIERIKPDGSAGKFRKVVVLGGW
jgi:C-terminal processing protease CtpA/Prc